MMRDIVMLTGNIARRARDFVTIPAQPLEIMGIMDVGFYAPRAPIECGVTLRAPHLIASVNLINPRSTVRAGFRIQAQELDRRNGFRITCMLSIASKTLDFVTLRARPLFAQPALPLTA